MNDYNSTDRGPPSHDHDDGERPHIYSTPVVSAPLITWFGLPTIIEFEQSAVAVDAQEVITDESEFKSIKGENHVRSYSQPAYSISKACRDQQYQQKQLLQQGKGVCANAA